MAEDSHTANLSGFFRSPIVTIIVGKDQIHHNVHIAALQASGSPSLQALVSKPWNGSTKPIDWSHWDLETAERVLTWLYERKYKIPSPSVYEKAHRKEHNDPSGANNATETDAAQTSTIVETRCALENGPVMSNTTDALHDHDLGLDRPLTPLENCVKIPETSSASWKHPIKFDKDQFPSSTYTYHEPLLALGRLHHFAIYHLCELLQDATLSQLISVLKCLDCSQPHATDDLMQLVSYIYANIPAEPHEHNSIRKVVSQFTAINYVDLMHDGFQEFVFDQNEFTAEVARKISRRLFATIALSQSLEEEIDTLNESMRANTERARARFISQESTIVQLQAQLKTPKSTYGVGFGKMSPSPNPRCRQNDSSLF